MDIFIERLLKSSLKTMVRRFKKLESEFSAGKIKAEGMTLNSAYWNNLLYLLLNGGFAELKNIEFRDFDLELLWKRFYPIGARFKVEDIIIDAEWLAMDKKIDLTKVVSKTKVDPLGDLDLPEGATDDLNTPQSTKRKGSGVDQAAIRSRTGSWSGRSDKDKRGANSRGSMLSRILKGIVENTEIEIQAGKIYLDMGHLGYYLINLRNIFVKIYREGVSGVRNPGSEGPRNQSGTPKTGLRGQPQKPALIVEFSVDEIDVEERSSKNGVGIKIKQFFMKTANSRNREIFIGDIQGKLQNHNIEALGRIYVPFRCSEMLKKLRKKVENEAQNFTKIHVFEPEKDPKSVEMGNNQRETNIKLTINTISLNVFEQGIGAPFNNLHYRILLKTLKAAIHNDGKEVDSTKTMEIGLGEAQVSHILRSGTAVPVLSAKGRTRRRSKILSSSSQETLQTSPTTNQPPKNTISSQTPIKEEKGKSRQKIHKSSIEELISGTTTSPSPLTNNLINTKVKVTEEHIFATGGIEHILNFKILIEGVEAELHEKLYLTKALQKFFTKTIDKFFIPASTTTENSTGLYSASNRGSRGQKLGIKTSKVRDIVLKHSRFKLLYQAFSDIELRVPHTKLYIKQSSTVGLDSINPKRSINSFLTKLELKEVMGFNKQSKKYDLLCFDLRLKIVNFFQIFLEVKQLGLFLDQHLFRSLQLLVKDLTEMDKFPKFLPSWSLFLAKSASQADRSVVLSPAEYGGISGLFPTLRDQLECENLINAVRKSQGAGKPKFKFLPDLFKFQIRVDSIGLSLDYRVDEAPENQLNLFQINVNELIFETAGEVNLGLKIHQNYDPFGRESSRGALGSLDLAGKFYFDDIDLRVKNLDLSLEYLDLYLLSKYLSHDMGKELYNLGYIVKIYNFLDSDFLTECGEICFKKRSSGYYPLALLATKRLRFENFQKSFDLKKVFSEASKIDYLEYMVARDVILVVKRTNQRLKMYFLAKKTVLNLSGLDFVFYNKCNPAAGIVIKSASRAKEGRLRRLSESLPQRFSELTFIRNSVLLVMDSMDSGEVSDLSDQEYDSLGCLDESGVENQESENSIIGRVEGLTVLKEMALKKGFGGVVGSSYPGQAGNGLKISIKILRNRVQKFTYLEVKTALLTIHAVYSELFLSLQAEDPKNSSEYCYPVYAGSEILEVSGLNRRFRIRNLGKQNGSKVAGGLGSGQIKDRAPKTNSFGIEEETDFSQFGGNQGRDTANQLAGGVSGRFDGSESRQEGHDLNLKKGTFRTFHDYNMTFKMVRFFAYVKIKNLLDQNLLFCSNQNFDPSEKIDRRGDLEDTTAEIFREENQQNGQTEDRNPENEVFEEKMKFNRIHPKGALELFSYNCQGLLYGLSTEYMQEFDLDLTKILRKLRNQKVLRTVKHCALSATQSTPLLIFSSKNNSGQLVLEISALVTIVNPLRYPLWYYWKETEDSQNPNNNTVLDLKTFKDGSLLLVPHSNFKKLYNKNITFRPSTRAQKVAQGEDTQVKNTQNQSKFSKDDDFGEVKNSAETHEKSQISNKLTRLERPNQRNDAQGQQAATNINQSRSPTPIKFLTKIQLQEHVGSLLRGMNIIFKNSHQAIEMKNDTLFKETELSKLTRSSALTIDRPLMMKVEMLKTCCFAISAESIDLESLGYILTIPSKKYAFRVNARVFALLRTLKDVRRITSNVVSIRLPIKLYRDNCLRVAVDRGWAEIRNRKERLMGARVSGLEIGLTQTYQIVTINAHLKFIELFEGGGNEELQSVSGTRRLLSYRTRQTAGRNPRKTSYRPQQQQQGLVDEARGSGSQEQQQQTRFGAANRHKKSSSATENDYSEKRILAKIINGRIALQNETIFRMSLYLIPFILANADSVSLNLRLLSQLQFLNKTYLLPTTLNLVFPPLVKRSKELTLMVAKIKKKSNLTIVKNSSTSDLNLILNQKRGIPTRLCQAFYSQFKASRANIGLEVTKRILKAKATTLLLEENVFKIIGDSLVFVSSKFSKMEEDNLKKSLRNQRIECFPYWNNRLIWQKRLPNHNFLRIYLNQILVGVPDAQILTAVNFTKFEVYKVEDPESTMNREVKSSKNALSMPPKTFYEIDFIFSTRQDSIDPEDSFGHHQEQLIVSQGQRGTFGRRISTQVQLTEPEKIVVVTLIRKLF